MSRTNLAFLPHHPFPVLLHQRAGRHRAGRSRAPTSAVATTLTVPLRVRRPLTLGADDAETASASGSAYRGNPASAFAPGPSRRPGPPARFSTPQAAHVVGRRPGPGPAQADA